MIPRCKECQHCELRNRARASLLADMDTEEDISSAKIKKQRGCREKLLEIRCRVL